MGVLRSQIQSVRNWESSGKFSHPPSSSMVSISYIFSAFISSIWHSVVYIFTYFGILFSHWHYVLFSVSNSHTCIS